MTDPAPTMLANRLKKNHRKLKSWLKSSGVTCYRIYDRDIPEIPLAIDRYEGSLHLSEYAPKGYVTDEEARARGERLRNLARVASETLGVPWSETFLKERRRQRGLDQYERVSERGVWRTVGEGGHLFRINLSDYLDAGLFLDHRPLRARVGAEAAGGNMLNLFGYTGSFSVYAAAGGARTTTTVDLSNTYLAWAQENMALNQFEAAFGPEAGARHLLIRADVRVWLEEARARRRRYDLIVLDPPTFSNSKRMEGTLDIQRDHGALLQGCVDLLTEGGRLYFSTNRRGFKLDPAWAARAEDLSAESVPVDFRERKIHQAWVIA